MSKVLVIGCGGVASVAISKCCQVSDVFTELCIASRTKSKCDALAAKLAPNTKTKITTAQVDADDVQQLCDLINSYKPDLVMNIALPYQDLTIMDACLSYDYGGDRCVPVRDLEVGQSLLGTWPYMHHNLYTSPDLCEQGFCLS